MGIPKKIHRVWLGGEMPAEYRQFERRWMELHPGWVVHTWREHELDWLRNRRAFDDAPLLSSKSNIARYEIVLREGGLYVDTDYEPLRALDGLLDGSELVLAEEEPGIFSNALFGASPGHPVLSAVVAGLSESHFARAGEISPQRTGPHYWTRSVRRALAEHPHLTYQVLTREQVMPYSWTQPHLRHADFPEAWAVHHWAKSWVADEPPRRAAMAAGRRAARRAAVSLKSAAHRLRARWEALEPTNRVSSSHPPVYLGEGRVLCFGSHGVPLLVPADAPELVAALVLDGHVDARFERFVELELRRGDVVVLTGAGCGALPLSAAWAIGRTGRVFAWEDDPRLRRFLVGSVEMNRHRGLQAEVIVGADSPEVPEGARDLFDALRGVPEIALLRLAAGPSQVRDLASAAKLLQRRSVRLLDLEVSDVAIGREWARLAELLRRIGEEHSPSSFTLGVDGKRIPMSIEAALNSDSVDHFVLELVGPAPRSA